MNSILTILLAVFTLIICIIFSLISVVVFKDSEKKPIDWIFLFLENAVFSMIAIITILFLIEELFV